MSLLGPNGEERHAQNGATRGGAFMFRCSMCGLVSSRKHLAQRQCLEDALGLARQQQAEIKEIMGTMRLVVKALVAAIETDHAGTLLLPQAVVLSVPETKGVRFNPVKEPDGFLKITVVEEAPKSPEKPTEAPKAP